jgi:hypothetical protein
MTHYLTSYSYVSALELPTPQEIVHADGVKVRVSPFNKVDENGVPLEFGLETEVHLRAANIEQACEIGAIAADLFITLLSVIHGCAISPPRFESAIDASPGTADRELVQKLPLPRMAHSKKSATQHRKNKPFSNGGFRDIVSSFV